MRLLAWVTAFLLASAAPASAGPVAAAVAAVFAGITVKAVALFALRLFAGIGLSILQQRRARRGRNTAFGLQVTATTRGELESETTIVGLYATKGHLIYHNSHGPNNKYYQTVIELGGLPGAAFSRVMVDSVYSELGEEAHPDYGFPLIAKRDLGRDYAWIKVYDGTQTAADPMLVANYAEDPETPWTEAHIGRGIPYAILTMEVSSKVWPNGAPEQRYEENGVPYYDLRRDSTAGGTGPHRWNDPTTWEPSRNPVVQIYNILRGIDLYDGSIWGGEAEAEDLPGWNWVPAMNACDVDLGERRKYEAGYEIKFAEDTPGEIIDELLAACNGQIAEFGGFFYIQVDAPDIPVASITDDDLLVTDAATKDPFPELLEIFNRVTAKYVSPGALWNGVPLNQIRNAGWEAEDGIARNFELDLPAVYNPGQAGQLAQAMLNDHRRWRRHAWPLPPDYSGLRPLNTVSVTSAWNDYANKLFEVTEIVLDLHRLTVVASLRERDPEDFEIDGAYEIPDRSSILPRPVPTDAGLPFFDAAAHIVTNAEGTRAHAAVDVFWDASGIAETIKGIAIECQKRDTQEEVWSGTVLDVERGLATIQPVPALTDLRVRAKALYDNRRGLWSAWIWVTTDDVRLSGADLDPALTTVTVPTGLALATVLVADALSGVSAVWGAVANAVSYEVGVTTGGVETIFPAGGTAWSRDGVPGTVFSIRVRAVSAIGTKSAWSAPVGITAAVDTIPPAVPSGLAAVGLFEAIWLKWTANTESDVSRYEIVERVSTTGPGVSTVPTYITTTPQFISQDLTSGETLNYWVRAVDTSGNKSGWSARVTATARATGDVITQETLQGLIDATSFAAGLEPITVVASLPAVKSTELVAFGGKIYRWNGTAYVASVASTDVVGQFTAASIAAGAIGADQLAAKSVRAGAMAIGSFDNLNFDADFEDPSAWSTPGLGTLSWQASNSSTSWGSSNLARLGGLGTNFTVSTSRFIFDLDLAGESIFFSYFARIISGTGTVYADLQLSKNPTFTGTANVDYTFRNIGAVTTTSITKLEGVITVPPGYRYARFRLIKGNNETTDCFIGGLYARRMNAGKLTVDGSLQARHIDVNDLVVAGLATVNTAYINSANIIDLNAEKLVAGSITTPKINGRAITDPSTFFENYGGGTKTPATAPSWNNATSFSVSVPDSGSILMIDCHVNWLLNGGSTVAPWGLRLLLNGTPFDSMGGSLFQEIVPFRRAMAVGTGTQTVVLQCQRGSSASFQIQNIHSVATILKR
ncbi:hypothetical protein RTM1035_05035 [Roseovarius sp. TM1035]|uniref:phage tail protein n=1 Tax=Roseovarius sp. TM1035 TaxID=391613 RepID=UPI00015569C0|nr:phage tail protein [Roseovarius sp. TM1035]AWZ21074.1 Exoglucanase A precursor [Roseovarius sp. AK1035]EDM32954.1 hypothetical protein RTM1035_05035 [Roseovarius sp. TM1035]